MALCDACSSAHCGSALFPTTSLSSWTGIAELRAMKVYKLSKVMRKALTLSKA
jgi:hypothetical protein